MTIQRIVILTTFFMLFLCSGNSLAEKNDLLIGAVYPLSGAAAHLGESNRRGATIAVDLINQRGGIDGRSLKLLVEDSKSEPTSGVSAFRNLVSLHNTQVILSTLTSVSMALKPLAEAQKIILLAESTHPQLVTESEYTFRHFFTGESAATALASFLRTNDNRRVAVLHAAEEFGEAAADALQNKLNRTRAKIVSRESFLKTEGDLRPQLLRIKASKPDFLYVVGIGAPMAIAVRQSKELGLNIQTAGYATCGQSDVIDVAAEYLDGTYSVEPFIDVESKAYKDLDRAHRIQFPESNIDQSTVAAFDAINIITMAFQQGARSAPEVRSFLRSQLKYSGAMGTVEFLESTDSVVPMVVSTFSNGRCKQQAS